jgi:superfamily II DNA or RNA helicase
MESSASTFAVAIDLPAHAPQAPTRDEALRVLTAEADRHVDGIPAAALAERALRVTAGGDFALARDALDALVRRAQAARRDELIVQARPARGSARGAYRVGRAGDARRSYDVWLDGLEPAAGSCSCADYAKAALGLCKHLIAVASDPKVRRARGEGERGPALRWDPIRPLTGAGDWLDRVSWDARAGAPPATLARLFSGGALRDGFAGDPPRRLAVVEALSAAIAVSRRAGRARVSAEPALLALLEREHERLIRIVRDGVPARDLVRHLGGLKQKLFPYQREGVRRFLAEGRLLLADDMGLGKTAQAIASCHALFAAGRVTRAVIVVPAALKPQWAREWQQFTDVPLTVVDGGPADRARQYRACRHGVLLVNYEQVIRDLAPIQRVRAELIVLDEAQRIKNWETKTAATIKQLDAPWRLVLTGTPMENRLGELASILEWVDEAALEPRWRLDAWHSIRVDGQREVIGARNLDTIRARLRRSMLRRVRQEVLRQLPSRRDVRIPVPLTEAQQTAHDELAEPIARLIAAAQRRPLARAEFLRLMSLFTQQRIICNGLAQRDFEETWSDLERARRPPGAMLARLDTPKLAELRELVAAIAVTQQRKIVVFSAWRRMLRLAAWAISDVLAPAGARAVFFTGEESQRRRTQNLVDFHDDPSTRVLLATDAGGVGLNLQRAASCCINLDLPWNPAVLEQRIGRIHRLGQARAVEVYHLIAETGIESRIAGLVADKRALFTGLFDGASDEVPFERGGSFLTRVSQIVVATTSAASSTEPGDDDDDRADEPSADAAPTPAPAPVFDGEQVSALLRQIVVKPASEGRVTLEAPVEAVSALGALLRGFASLLDPARS